jgi:hypothetical protein
MFSSDRFIITATRAATVGAAIPSSCLTTFGGCSGYEATVRRLGGDITCELDGEICRCLVGVSSRDRREGTLELRDGTLVLTADSGEVESFDYCASGTTLELRSKTASSTWYMLNR